MDLTHSLNQNQDWKQLIEEPEHYVEQRKNLSNSLTVLKNSIKIIKKDPDFWSYNSQQNYDQE